MTGNEIVTDLRSRIVEPSPTFFSQTRMLSLINLAQNEYVRLTRVLQSFAYTSSIQGQADYPMPLDWLGAEKVFYNDVGSTPGGTPNWRPLNPTNLEKLGQETPNFLSTDPTTQGAPRNYYVVGKTLYLYPRPLTNGTNDIFMFYESKAPQLLSLSDSISIDDSLYPGVRAYVLMELYGQDGEDAKEAKWDTKFATEIGRGFKWRNKRILDGKWKLDIESFIPYSYNSGLVAQTINPLNQ